jgi:hypothetical protein
MRKYYARFGGGLTQKYWETATRWQPTQRYSLILLLYVKQWHRVTVEQIIPKYAPGSDGNDEKAYIAAIEYAVATWRRGVVWV